MRYELLTPDNLPYAINLAKELHALGVHSIAGPEFDWHYSHHAFPRLYATDDGYMQLAVDDGGTYVGAVCGRIYPFIFSPRLQGIEDAWYVREGTPKRAAVACHLMRNFVSWCLDEKDALFVQTGDIADINAHAVDTLYRHLGFKRFGSVYKYQRT